MTSVGRHLVVDAFGCSSAALDDADLLNRLLSEAVSALGAQVLHTYFHRFEPQGVTGAIIISTSHLAIHTWPETHYAAFDLFTCGDGDLQGTARAILDRLGAAHSVVREIDRGYGGGTAMPGEGIPPKMRRGDWWDQVELRELLAGPHRLLHQGVSQYQEILVIEARDVRMYLDGQLQFSSLDERSYHEALVHPAMTLAPSRDRVLILGGGDGLAMREVLKYPDVRHVALVDIDPVVLACASQVPELIALNEGALVNPRAQVHARDAVAFVSEQHPPYDVMIIDFPDPADETISRLYTTEVFSSAAKLLRPGGILVCQSHSPAEAPRVFWSIGRTLESAGLKTLSYHVELASFGDWGFHLGSSTAPVWRGQPIPVPHRTLPESLAGWFRFSKQVAAARRRAAPNSLSRLVLHHYYEQAVGTNPAAP